MSKTILILSANPRDTSRLRLDQEMREIANGLQRAQRRDDFILQPVLAARPKDVRRAMLDSNPNIVHFCGHGSGKEGIAFEDENGQTKLVSTDALSGFFELFTDRLECVVLNACYSEVQAEAIAKHIPYVIGMKRAIGDAAAIEFAVAFYDALGAGRSVEFAYKLACNAIQWAGIPEHLTPTLKSRKLSGSKNQTDRDREMALLSEHPKGEARTIPTEQSSSEELELFVMDSMFASTYDLEWENVDKQIGLSLADLEAWFYEVPSDRKINARAGAIVGLDLGLNSGIGIYQAVIDMEGVPADDRQVIITAPIFNLEQEFEYGFIDEDNELDYYVRIYDLKDFS